MGTRRRQGERAERPANEREFLASYDRRAFDPIAVTVACSR